MFFSRASSYGILTVIYLALVSDKQPRPIRTIADDLEIPPAFLAKIVQTLVQQGIVCSYKGPGGGVKLAWPPSELTLGQVVIAIDGVDYQSTCLLGMPGCSTRSQCLFQACRNKIQSGFSDLLSDQSLSQVARTFKGQMDLSFWQKSNKISFLILTDIESAQCRFFLHLSAAYLCKVRKILCILVYPCA